jgi:hypothetical protein
VSLRVVRQRQTVHGAWHLNVGEQRVDTGPMGLENGDRVVSVSGLPHIEALIAQEISGRRPDEDLILDDDDNDLRRHFGASPDPTPFNRLWKT